METIAAIATGVQRTALGIIRLSGDTALQTAEACFRPCRGGALGERRPGLLVLGELLDTDGGALDQALAVWNRAPHSFTGEDTVEFQCHGSPAVLTAALRMLFHLGVRQAEPGEFSRRAFLNRRLDLTQAEAIADLVDAETAMAAKQAAAQLGGAVSVKTDAVYQSLLGLEAKVQAAVDYPDEGVEETELRELSGGLEAGEAALLGLLQSFHRGQLVKEGIRCALIGKPNVGKSSLLNLLLGYDRAIVTEIAGTTRDTLEEKLTIGGLLLRLTDTAGLRKTGDAAEAEGVLRAEAEAKRAALVLAVFDGAQALSAEDEPTLNAAKNAEKAIALVNKMDLPRELDVSVLADSFEAVIPISAKTGEGLPELERTLKTLLGGESAAPVGEVLANARQYEAVLRAQTALRRGIDGLAGGLTPDAVLTDVEEALQALGELNGRALREDLVEEIFSRFCVGK